MLIEGFIPSKKDELRRRSEELPKVDIKTFGVYHLFSEMMKEEISSLRATFGKDMAERLLSFAMFRRAYQTPIKRAGYYHAHDFCSEFWSRDSLSDKHVSLNLKQVGENRQLAVEWMKSLLKDVSPNEQNFVLMDSTHQISVSENPAVNAQGYNPDFDFDKQIRLMYLFSAQMKQPVYYRMVNGNIPDVKSMWLHGFGALTVVYNLETEENIEKSNAKPKSKKKTSAKKPIIFEQMVYQSYRQRNEIEVMFDSYKNYLEADASYMQNRYVLEGWLFANFPAMIAYYKLYARLREAELLSKFSPKDIIEQSKAICQMEIRGVWHRSEMTVKTIALFKKIKIDFLK